MCTERFIHGFTKYSIPTHKIDAGKFAVPGCVVVLSYCTRMYRYAPHGSASASNMSEFFQRSNSAENLKLRTKKFKEIKLGKYQLVFRVWFQQTPTRWDGWIKLLYVWVLHRGFSGIFAQYFILQVHLKVSVVHYLDVIHLDWNVENLNYIRNYDTD